MPEFTRRHYIAIAHVLKTSKTKKEIVDNLVKGFKHDNPNFDEVRFREAIGEQSRSPKKSGGNPVHVKSHARRKTRGVRAHTRRR